MWWRLIGIPMGVNRMNECLLTWTKRRKNHGKKPGNAIGSRKTQEDVNNSRKGKNRHQGHAIGSRNTQKDANKSHKGKKRHQGRAIRATKLNQSEQQRVMHACVLQADLYRIKAACKCAGFVTYMRQGLGRGCMRWNLPFLWQRKYWKAAARGHAIRATK